MSRSESARVLPGRPAIARAAVLAALLAAGLAVAPAAAEVPCDMDLSNSYGPYDYTDPLQREQKLRKVEQFHFHSAVKKRAYVGDPTYHTSNDLDYILRASPNHHPALHAMAVYQHKLRQRRGAKARQRTDDPRDRLKSVDCYFKRAQKFKPDDPGVYTTYGVYLHRVGRLEDAREQFERAVELLPDNAYTQYNLGLIHFAMKDYEQAREHAERAYDLGYPRGDLRAKLMQAGHWRSGGDGQ